MKEWFQNWFNSPYYRLLYRHRDESEAENFIKVLLKVMSLDKDSRILDMPCGNGRHARVLADMGYNVTAADLSERNIEEATTNAKSNLHFVVHDMRFPIAENYFNAVLNLFTSFGYFTSAGENEKTLQAFSIALKPNGILVIDFFNKNSVCNNLKNDDSRRVEDVEFLIERKIESNHVVKKIEVNDGGKRFQFEERVQLLELKDFEQMLTSSGFRIEKIFGNYSLEPFSENSERLILIARKNG